MNLKNTSLKQNKLAYRRLLGGIIISALIAFWLTKQCNKERKLTAINGVVFSTTYEVKVVLPNDDNAIIGDLKTSINKELDLVDRAMSRFRKDSEIARFNAFLRTDAFRVSTKTAELIEKARYVSKASDGAFDITVEPLVQLWGFYNNQREGAAEPNADDIAQAKSMVGYEKLQADSNHGYLKKSDPNLRVDLSAIAKGYAVDRVACAIEKAGYRKYMVEIGGEVRAKGINQNGLAWRIGIEKPMRESRELSRAVELKDRAIATSGDYRNYYKLNGRFISHIIDPRIGKPIQHQLASVSVIHDECAMADAFATAFNVLGPKDGYNLAKALGIPALFISRRDDGSFEEQATPGFESLVVSGEKKEATPASESPN